ncbi:MAG: hypothetical protein L0211_19555, partial [Planctomycetaceae bacterium]|nr:hypothetical protein [Planctomycetaceae bacterium]
METSVVWIGENRVRFWLTAGLLVLIGLAAYRIGLNFWGMYHRRAVDVALSRRDFAHARIELAKCLWIWPKQPELQLQLARLARRQNLLDEARQHLRHCNSDGELAVVIGLEQCLLEIQTGEFGNSAQLDQYAREHPEFPEAMLIEEAQIKGSLAMLDLPRARAYLATWQERRTATPDQVQGLLWQA